MLPVPVPIVLLATVPPVAPLEVRRDREPMRDSSFFPVAQAIAPAADGTSTTVTPVPQTGCVSGGNACASAPTIRFDITGGQRSRDGANLFHSFEQFNVEAGQMVNFLSSPGIQNILGRVTGGNASFINGLIQVMGGNSNLFLMNPAGIAFGPNASLNVPGDFFATTATGIGFGTEWFNAIADNNWTALVGTPSAFAFNVSQPGAIVNFGHLAIGSDRNLTLLGGTVLNAGTLSSPGGTITIAAVPGESVVRISQDHHLLSLDIANGEWGMGHGEWGMGHGEWGMEMPAPQSLPELLTGGGLTHATTVRVNADGTIALTGSGIGFDPKPGTAIAAGTIDVSDRGLGVGETSTATVAVLGRQVAVIDANINASGTNGGGTVLIGGDFQGNGRVPNAVSTWVSDRSTIDADAIAKGNGGRIIVWADESTRFEGAIAARGGESFGNGGFVEVSGKETLLFFGSVDTRAPQGTVGTLLLDPRNIIIAPGGSHQLELNDEFSENIGASAMIPGSVLSAAIDTSSVTLQANNDISIDDAIAATTPGNGLTLQAGRSISFTGNGSVTLNGGDFRATINDSNANLSDRNLGGTTQFLMNVGAQIQTNGGNITIDRGNLVGGDVGAVRLFGATIASGTGDIQISGKATSGIGISLDDGTVVESTGNGSITLTGTGGANGSLTGNHGIYMNNGSQVRSLGTGAIAIEGTGGRGTDFNVGIWMRNGNSGVSSYNGEIAIAGTGAGTGTDNHGIYILNGGMVESTGTGRVTIAGTGGGGTDVNYGILIRGMNSHVSSFDGDVSLTGTGSGSGINNTGFFLGNGGVVESTGTGNITAIGTGANGASGIRLSDGSIDGTSRGNITLIADEIRLDGTTQIRGSGIVQLQPIDPTLDITIGGAIDDGRLNLDASELATLQPGFSQIVIGADTGSGAIALTGDISFNDSILIQSPNGSGTIDTREFALTGNAAIALNAHQNISTGNITNLGQPITLTSTNGSIDSSFGTLDSSAAGNGGDITLISPLSVTAGNINSSGLPDTGHINITSREINFTGTSVRGQGKIYLQPDTSSQNIAIAGTDNSTAALDLTTTDLTALQPGFTQIAISRADSTATITLHPFNFQSVVHVEGGSTLIGANQDTNWTITGTNAGNISGFNELMTFASIENLTGGNLNDTFIFNDAGAIDGDIDGVGITDTLDYSAVTGEVTINLAENTATAVGGNISSIENAIGSGSNNNTLIGPNLPNIWNITGIDSGTVNQAIAFSDFQNLTGGNVDDTFQFSENGSISGNLNGVGITDTLDYSAVTGEVTINLAENTATAVGGNISSIENAIGSGSNNNTLIGPNLPNIWNITGIDSGTVGNVSFSAFQNLTGGNLSDTFILNSDASISTLNGGNGNNTLVGSHTANIWNLTGTDTGTLNETIAFSNIQNLTGGNVDDTFKFDNNANISGNIDGVDITDTLDYSAYTSSVTVNLAENTATGVGGAIASIENVIGSPSNDHTLIGANTANIWNVTGNNAGEVNNVSFTFFKNLIGGNLDDTFIFTDGASIDGMVDGGIGGTNSLDYSAYTSPVTVDIVAGMATATGAIANIQYSMTPPASVSPEPEPPSTPPLSEEPAIEVPAIESPTTPSAPTTSAPHPPTPISPAPTTSAPPPPTPISPAPLSPTPIPLAPTTSAPPPPAPISPTPTPLSIAPAPISPTPTSSVPIAPAPIAPVPTSDAIAPTVPAPIAPAPIQDDNNAIESSLKSPLLLPENSPSQQSELTAIESASSFVSVPAPPPLPDPILPPAFIQSAPVSVPSLLPTSPKIDVSEVPSSLIPTFSRTEVPELVLPLSEVQNQPILRRDSEDYEEPLAIAKESINQNLEAIALSVQYIERFLKEGNIPEVLRFLDLIYTEEYARYLNLVYARELQSFSDIQDKLQAIALQTGTKPAVIYTFIRPESLDLVLVPPQGLPIYQTVPINREMLLQFVTKFREEITNPLKRNRKQYLGMAQHLYEWIIAPLQTDIQILGIETLVFSMDGGLRTLPLAALHDGQQFLIEKYSIGLIPSVNLTDTSYESLKNSRILAMGASTFPDKVSLPAVPVELEIVTSYWPGKSFLNEEFTLENLKLQRTKEPFKIIHLATHSEFNPGDPKNSYIQLWQTQLSLDRLRDLKWNDPPVELLVLSACRTAIGDEQAELGFAGLAVNAGVKSALASLWYVNDEGTLGLMSEFYHQLRSAPIKAEALRQAQLAMIRGIVRIESGHLVSSDGMTPLPEVFKDLYSGNLSHPYYWSGFTMIGSPW